MVENLICVIESAANLLRLPLVFIVPNRKLIASPLALVATKSTLWRRTVLNTAFTFRIERNKMSFMR